MFCVFLVLYSDEEGGVGRMACAVFDDQLKELDLYTCFKLAKKFPNDLSLHPTFG